MSLPCLNSPWPQGNVRVVSRRKPALPAALFAACLGLAACGGGGGSSTEADAQAAQPDAAEALAESSKQTTAASRPVRVRANRAPKLTGTPSTHATAAWAYSFVPTGSDLDGNRLTYSIVNKPSWASFNSATGALTGTPPTSAIGNAFPNVTIAVSDGSLTASLAPFEIYVYSAVGNDQPSGIYALDQVINEPFVDGVAVRPKWSEMEPSEGVYDFSKIDKAVRDAAAAGQKVTIASLVNFAPEWLLAKATSFDYLGTRTIYPWDETMLAALEKLVQAQAAHQVDGMALRNHPAVAQVNASIGGVTSIRLIDLPPGYTASKMTAAVDRSIGFWAKAYPTGKHLYVGLFSIADGVNSPSTAEIIRDRLLKTYNGSSAPRLHFFQEVLTGQTPKLDEGNLGTIMLGVEGRAGVMFQACGPWTGQDSDHWSCKWVTPVDSPALGMQFANENYGAIYYEFYKGDLEHEAYRSMFQTWHARIEDALD
jgi:hypothetical protein